MFRRPLRRIFTRPMFRSALGDEIAQAGQLLASGQSEQAAVILTRLAHQMQSLGRPRQAANLHAQAAHAWLDAENEAHALQQAHLALELFARLGMGIRAHEFKNSFANHLRERTLQEAAQRFEEETKIAPAPQPAAGTQPRRGKLPPTCPQCGAPVRSDMAEWVDDHSAVCDFCGSTIAAMN
jgi:hypothetical protein